MAVSFSNQQFFERRLASLGTTFVDVTLSPEMHNCSGDSSRRSRSTSGCIGVLEDNELSGFSVEGPPSNIGPLYQAICQRSGGCVVRSWRGASKNSKQELHNRGGARSATWSSPGVDRERAHGEVPCLWPDTDSDFGDADSDESSRYPSESGVGSSSLTVVVTPEIKQENVQRETLLLSTDTTQCGNHLLSTEHARAENRTPSKQFLATVPLQTQHLPDATRVIELPRGNQCPVLLGREKLTETPTKPQAWSPQFCPEEKPRPSPKRDLPSQKVQCLKAASRALMIAENSLGRIRAEAKSRDAPEQNHVTTLMIRNIPHELTQQLLLQALDDTGFTGLYNFCYLPRSFSDGLNLGYAFVNFVSADVASSFINAWHRQARLGSSSTSLNIRPAALQGLEANMKKWCGARMLRVRNVDFRPFVVEPSQ